MKTIYNRARDLAREALENPPKEVPSRELARLIDNTFLHPEATPQEVARFAAESARWEFRGLVVGTSRLRDAKPHLNPSTKLVAVVGFPLGFYPLKLKLAEAEEALRLGAEEIDFVPDLGKLKAGDYGGLKEEVRALKGLGVPVKVILEVGLLKDAEKVEAARAAAEAGADFVKTSTGFLAGGATLYDVALLRLAVGDVCGVKASGGIRTREDALRMLAAGADVLGTSSGLRIVEG